MADEQNLAQTIDAHSLVLAVNGSLARRQTRPETENAYSIGSDAKKSELGRF